MSRVWFAGRVVTCDPARAAEANELGVLEDGAVVVDEGRIVWAGPRASAPAADDAVDAPDAVLTPGLVDAHTHAAWMGSRHMEYALRMAGADYRDIAAAGGGIVATQRAVTAATEEAVAATLARRLSRMAQLGVTCVEVKSGYGLEPEEELKQLRAIASASGRADLPAVVPTFLALHALPARAKDSSAARQAYVEHTRQVLLPQVAKASLARFVDAYVDANAFTVDEARSIGEQARAHGLGLRMHVGQFADVGAAELCAELGVASADHLEHLSARGARALAEGRVSAGLLPTACFTLGQTPPSVAQLRDAGIPMIVASDANPGTAPSESLPLAMALAVRFYGMTPEEVILGATRIAAESLAEADRGKLAVGAWADMVLWDLPHEFALVQPWGTPRARLVVRQGADIAHG
jgi:imidazolonepropionase